MDDKLKQEIRKKLDTTFGLLDELEKESDRGCCLMAVAFLEGELADLLLSKLVGSKTFLNPLFEFNGPLGTFSSRIKMSFALGFITNETLLDLEAVRKIRNEFGHKYEPINFETLALKTKVVSLSRYKEVYKTNKETKIIFINCVIGLLAAIHSAQYKGKALEELKGKNKKMPESERAKIREKGIADFVIEHLEEHEQKSKK